MKGENVSCQELIGKDVGPDPIDYEGRWAFLDAIERHWQPSPLDTLQRFSAPIARWLDWDTFTKTPAALVLLSNHSWPWRFSNLMAEDTEQARAAIHAVQCWRGHLPINETDGWMMDAAIHTTMASLVLTHWPDEWVYNPPENPRPSFTIELRAPVSGEDLDIYRASSEKWFSKKLSEYLSRLRKAGSLNRETWDHADWTARRWMSETPNEIYLSLKTTKSCKKGRERTADSIRTAIRRFSRGIRLSRPARLVAQVRHGDGVFEGGATRAGK